MILLRDRTQRLVLPPGNDGNCNDCAGKNRGENPTHLALAIVRFRTCTLPAICTVFETRPLTGPSDQRSRLISVAQQRRMAVGRHQ